MRSVFVLIMSLFLLGCSSIQHFADTHPKTMYTSIAVGLAIGVQETLSQLSQFDSCISIGCRDVVNPLNVHSNSKPHRNQIEVKVSF